jgi:hypothetical protein
MSPLPKVMKISTSGLEVSPSRRGVTMDSATSGKAWVKRPILLHSHPEAKPGAQLTVSAPAIPRPALRAAAPDIASSACLIPTALCADFFRPFPGRD